MTGVQTCALPIFVLEDELARFVGLPAALLFPSGYQANTGLLAAVAGPGDRILSDQLNHASLIDGCRLSRAAVEVYPHLDLDCLESLLRRPLAGRTFVVTESLFSMDGDLQNLVEIRTLCDRYGASLVVDEAHALGVLGPQGRGAAAAVGVVPDALVGTLGKAFGVAGAFVAGPVVLRDWLVSKCRTYAFTTAVAPPVAGAARAALALVERADDARARLVALGKAVREVLGRRVSPSYGPILPVPLGDPAAAMRVSAALLDRGWFVQGIRPPTVPVGTARLRLTLMATHAPEQVLAAARAIAELVP